MGEPSGFDTGTRRGPAGGELRRPPVRGIRTKETPGPRLLHVVWWPEREVAYAGRPEGLFPYRSPTIGYSLRSRSQSTIKLHRYATQSSSLPYGRVKRIFEVSFRRLFDEDQR